ncbi:MAG: DUF1353 domain-containing protein [Betaproteobacteria bacterium]|nr:MAG: DUF1353 domain-containing protein [Betaproteobacteria bacterium]
MMSIVGIGVLALSLGTSAADTAEPAVGRFDGQAELERLDDDPFVPSFRLIGELRFQQVGGPVWVTPSNTILDGRAMPTLFVQLFGHPFEGQFLKTAISYEYAAQKKDRTHQEAQRMFYDAAVTERVAPGEAKVMYTVLSASGSRWAMRGPNSCFRRCHTDAKELEWRPRVDHEKLVALLEWVRRENPTLDAVDQRASEAILEEGPHIFGNLN